MDELGMLALSPPFCPSALSREELIVYYSQLGLPVQDIRRFLLDIHGYSISVRHLVRLRKTLHVGRRSRNESPFREIVAVIRRECASSGKLLGYRSMWNRLNASYGLCVRRKTVMMLLSIMDPDGTENRKQRKIIRRTYRSQGPNFIWHIDGYDKLKPYGITIHGCIDGYSRRIMWAKVAYSNNNPCIIAKHYLECVDLVGGCPSMLRADRGSENSIVAFLQPCLRHEHLDDHAKENSFQYGRSSANQRIEAWWSYLRSHMTEWWIVYLKDLQLNGYLDNTLQHHIYSFGPVIQKQLSQLVMEWNHHRIRKTLTAEAPGGIPEVLYHLPPQDVVDCKHMIDETLLSFAKGQYCCSGQILVDENYRLYANAVCAMYSLSYPPTTHVDALLMYFLLKDDGDLFV